MALYKIADFNPSYREDAFEGKDIKGFEAYTGERDQKIGTVKDVLVDESGRFRYLVIDTGVWVLGKKVLLPVGRSRMDLDSRRVYAMGLTSKEQAERLPDYDPSMTIDYDYEEQVRSIYRSKTETTATSLDQSSYTYEREPALYEMNQKDNATFKLYEERLVTSKEREQAGEVAVGKRVETETAQASVPVESEQVIIERRSPEQAETSVTPGEVEFEEGEVARMEVYEETAKIQKEAFVREEVNVTKETEKETVQAQETLRREELELDVEGNPVVKRQKGR